MKKSDARRKLSGGVHRDREDDKRFPNAVGAIFRMLFREWEQLSELEKRDGVMTSLEFVERTRFLEIFERTVNRYPKNNERSPADQDSAKKKAMRVAGILENLGTQKAPLEYVRLRSAVDYLEICEAAFFALSRLISLERRSESAEEARKVQVQYLDAFSRFLDAARREVLSEETLNAFSRADSTTRDGREIWVADAAVIRRLITEYHDGDLDAVEDVLNRD